MKKPKKKKRPTAAILKYAGARGRQLSDDYIGYGVRRRGIQQLERIRNQE